MKQSTLSWLWSKCVVGNLKIGDPVTTLNDIKFKSTYDDNKSNIIRVPSKQGENTDLIVIESEKIETFQTNHNITPIASPSVGFGTENDIDNAISSSSCSVDVDEFYAHLKDKCARLPPHKKRRISHSICAALINSDYNQNQNRNANHNMMNDSNNIEEIVSDDDLSESVLNLALNRNINNNVESFLSYNSNVMVIKQNLVNGVEDINFKEIEIGTFHIGKCALRVAAQLNRNSECIGTLLLIKHSDIKNNQIIITDAPVGYLANYFNNPKKLAEDLSSAISLAAGINASFTPTVVGRDSDLEKAAGIAYLKRFLIPQSNRIKRSLECVDAIGRTIIGDNLYITLPGGTIVDVANKKSVSSLEANIYMEGWADKIKPEDYKHYPRLIDGQVNEPISADKLDTLINLVANPDNLENVVLFVVLLAMQLIPLVGWKHLMKYGGGVMLLLVIYGLPKSSKSWLLRLAESLYGINHFTDNVAELGQSKNILEDWTTKGLQYKCKRIVGFARKCEDGDRPGNKESCGGPEAVIWGSAGFGDTITKGGGDEVGNTSAVVMTVNSTPTFYDQSKNNKNKKDAKEKDDGSASRGLFWHHQSGHDIASRTQKQAQQANKLVQPLVVAFQKRTGTFLTNCIPSDKRLSKAGAWIDRMNTDLTVQYPYLKDYLFDSRQQSSVKLLLGYGNKICKNILNFDRSKFTAGIFNWNFKTATFWYKMNGNPMFLIEDKYKSPIDMIKYFLQCFTIVNMQLEIASGSIQIHMEVEENENENKEIELKENDTKENVDVDVILNELKELQIEIKKLHLVELFVRKNNPLIGFNISNKIQYGHIIKVFELFDKLLIASENYTFCDIDTTQFMKWKYNIVKMAELNNIFAYLESKNLIFTNQSKYNGVRMGFDNVEYRFKSVVIPSAIKPIWQQLFNKFGKNGKKIGVALNKNEKNKKKKGNDNNNALSTQQNDNENNNLLLPEQMANSNHDLDLIYVMGAKSMLNILNVIINDNNCGNLFIQPVDINEYPSYEQQIKNIICLKDIQLKIQNNVYNTNAWLFAQDMRLVFNNAKEFNEADSDIYTRACDLLSKFEMQFMQQMMQSKHQQSKVKINLGTNVNAKNVGLR